MSKPPLYPHISKGRLDPGRLDPRLKAPTVKLQCKGGYEWQCPSCKAMNQEWHSSAEVECGTCHGIFPVARGVT